MDLGTTHMAYTTHAQDAQRAAREQERQRVIRERVAERTAAQNDAATPPCPSPRPSLFGFLRLRRA